MTDNHKYKIDNCESMTIYEFMDDIKFRLLFCDLSLILGVKRVNVTENAAVTQF